MDESSVATISAIDAPLKGKAEDKLEREAFASLVRTSLLLSNDQGATIVAITGGWGSGKSSVANMALEDIDDSLAKVVRFDPWMVTSAEALAREFFATLGNAAFPSADGKARKAARAKFYDYAARAMDLVSIGTGALGSVAPGASVISSTSKKVGALMQTAADVLEQQARQPSLRDARDEISGLLRTLKTPILVVIDDIDRLSHDEVRTTFQIIKACADFPNVRYLLLYDRDQVIHALEESVNDPAAFLEKIVGQSFDLPEATTVQRTELLTAHLASLGFHVGLSEQARGRLGSVFNEVLLPGLPTVRHVKRFVNTVRSLLPGVIQDGFLNVDPGDFLALEYIRQYAPDLYRVLRDENTPIPGGTVFRIAHKDDLPKLTEKRRAGAIQQLRGDQQQQLAKEAMDALSLQSDLSRHALSNAEKRFATEYWRPVYFGFTFARATVSETKWQEFVALLATGKALDVWIKDWDDRELRDRWVSAIITRAPEIPKRFIAPFLSEIFTWGDNQKYDGDVFRSRNKPWSSAIWWCAESILETLDKPAKAVAVFIEAAERSGSVVSAGYVVGLEMERIRTDRWATWSRGVDLKAHVFRLRKRMKRLIDSGKIWSLPDPRNALSAWYYLAGKKVWDTWYQGMMKDQETLAKYLNFSLGSQRSEGEETSWGFDNDGMVEAIRNVDQRLLDENGKWAREHALKSFDLSWRRQRERAASEVD